MNRTLATLVVAVTVVLAGCAGAGGPTTTATTTDGTTTDGTTTGGTAQVAFYVSDRPGAIGDFEHLNVTITRVGFHLVESANDTTDVTSTVNATSTTTNTTTTNTTTTATTTTTAGTATTEESESQSGGGEWVERDVNDTTVDLTRLQGENASLLGNVSVPAGTYDKVFAYVSEVNGTLTTGESVNVKLPSQKLHVNSEFTLNASSSAHFVYDINVVKAGNSGKYIVKPVVSETGLNKPVNPVRMHEDGMRGTDGSLTVSFAGNVSAGENVTVRVTENGSAVANATVTVNGERVGTTDANGTITVTVPDADHVRVLAEAGDDRGTLSVRLSDRGGNGGSDGGQSA
ncbi:DUF4382 domain-containing protein [Salarchaeum sp. JOR-1]|uniref:DUF4382 domain-containing protein n=1 Tax=Salarchaeum sp. JOR-1 TaxID=2599399 RepID=UPI00119846B3|nr:DUF4382 domain-containing protein [Salarchaeum sp. JOR-1]QDX40108.1 DUF4382 domain-containing protein [Salarchaeum sp. JOR-1]